MKLDKRIAELLGEMRKANTILEGSADDGGRKAAALDGQAEITQKLVDTDEQREAKAAKDARKANLEAQVEALTKLMADNRSASEGRADRRLAAGIARPGHAEAPAEGQKPHPFMKAAFTKGYGAARSSAASMDARRPRVRRSLRSVARGTSARRRSAP